MERLTRADIDNVELVEFENYSVHKCLEDIDTADYLSILGALMKLQDYEDMEEEGILFKFPCKVGDTVYVEYYGEITEARVDEIVIYSDGPFVKVYIDPDTYKEYDIDEVYKYEENAKEALKELEESDG